MLRWLIMAVGLIMMTEMAVGIRFVIDREECFSHDVKYEGDTFHFSFVVVKADAPWQYGGDEGGVDLLVKGPEGELVHQTRGKASEKFEFVVQKRGLYRFCFTNRSPDHETRIMDLIEGGKIHVVW